MTLVSEFITEQRKEGVHLPAATEATLLRWGLIKKERGFIWMLHNLGEWGTPCLIAHLLCKNQTKTSRSQQDQNKRQCLVFLVHFKVPFFGACRQLLSGHSGSLACFQLLSGFRLPPRGCV